MIRRFCNRTGRCRASGAETPTLRLFGPAREAAGTGSDHFQATTVRELMGLAFERYPEQFSKVVSTSRIWVNGNDAGPDHPLSEDDEVAVIPPISGGS